MSVLWEASNPEQDLTSSFIVNTLMKDYEWRELKKLSTMTQSWWNTKFSEMPLKEKYRERWIFEFATEKVNLIEMIVY